MRRLAFTVMLLILGYQTAYAQYFEGKSKFAGFPLATQILFIQQYKKTPEK